MNRAFIWGVGEYREKNSRKKLTCLVYASRWIMVLVIAKEDSEKNMKRGGGDFRYIRFSGA